MYGPVSIGLATPAYIVYVAYVFARRVVQPSYVSRHLENWRFIYIFGSGSSRYAQTADFLKLLEAIFEANLQAITGGFQFQPNNFIFEKTLIFPAITDTLHRLDINS